MKTDNRFWIGLGIFFLIIGVICFFPYWFTSMNLFDIDFSQSGEIGDTIGGIMTPFIAIAASILTFLAFWVQYQANVQQRKQFQKTLKKQKKAAKEQENIWRIERFENRYYELIRLHKANVDEMNIADKVRGKKCFVHMFYELKFCYKTVVDFLNIRINEKDGEQFSKINALDLSYMIFFYGLGHHSEKHFVHYLNPEELEVFKSAKGLLNRIQDKYLEHSASYPDQRYYSYGLPFTFVPDEKTVEFYYYPYDGHVNRLGHYYRHLFQTATYVITRDFLSEQEKYSYIKTLRAQLSNFEQLMLYYNGLAWFDKEWRTLFTTYRLIKNLPLSLADFHINPEIHFQKEISELRAKGIEMFEWHER